MKVVEGSGGRWYEVDERGRVIRVMRPADLLASDAEHFNESVREATRKGVASMAGERSGRVVFAAAEKRAARYRSGACDCEMCAPALIG